MSYHGREVTAAVPAGPAQGADNVEHLKLELWTRSTEKNMNVLLSNVTNSTSHTDFIFYIIIYSISYLVLCQLTVADSPAEPTDLDIFPRIW